MEKRPTEEGRATTMCKQSPTRGTPGAAATYTAFLDALLTNVCCADKGAIDVDADIIVSGRDGVIGDEDVSTDGASTSNNRSGNDGSKSPTKDVSNNDTATPMVKEPLAESILPLLRFNPLMSTSIRQNENIPSSISSLDEFFDLFLRDDAPHSFLSFHKSKGDEERAERLINLSKMEKELDWLRESVISPDSKVAFCHNDLLPWNNARKV